MCKTYNWVGDAVYDRDKYRKLYRENQNRMAEIKKKLKEWAPESGVSKEFWEMSCQEEMWPVRNNLKNLAQELKDIRKEIRRLDKLSNLKNNKSAS